MIIDIETLKEMAMKRCKERIKNGEKHTEEPTLRRLKEKWI
jgi:hypothetical protein